MYYLCGVVIPYDAVFDANQFHCIRKDDYLQGGCRLGSWKPSISGND